MDWILFSTMSGVELLQLVITYDIACQWWRNFSKRMRALPPPLQIPLDDVEVSFAVPPFHLRNHGNDCQANFSLGFMPGAGRTCGEGIETEWAHMNGIATSIREMSPCAHRETIDDHWGGWNWRKIVGFGTSFLLRISSVVEWDLGSFFVHKLKEAREEHDKHTKILDDFSDGFAPELRATWLTQINKWELDFSQPNPYIEPALRK